MTFETLRRITLAGLAFGALLLFAACGGGTTPAQNSSPTASFTATPESGEEPLTVQFSAAGSSDADGTITSYVWDLGDGGTATGSTASRTYSAGTYTVKLTVTDDDGATASASRNVTVTAAAPGTISGTVSSSSTTTVEGAALDVGARGVALPSLDGSLGAGPRGDAAAGVGSWDAAAFAAAGIEFVPGEIIVKFASGVQTQAAHGLEVAGARLERVRGLPAPALALYRAPALDAAGTLQAVAALEARPDVVYAQPNYIRYPLATPNDEYYGFQWHYPAINLPQAWDITTGSTSTVVAIVDTGILYLEGDTSASHPDFTGKVLAGYDFISDPTNAGDGDGRDPDPYDMGGDMEGGGSSYHGTHVGGTVAAATDNTTGVAGVDWNAKLIALRVLGAAGGSTADIMEATAWAAGLSVTGVPDNANPASVINMSLGGSGTCSAAEQEIFDMVRSTAIVIVAAGNSDQDASGFSPASCTGVITVGATDYAGARAPYSNYGLRIDVMAPGGDMSADLNADGYPDGVASLTYDPSFGFDYWFENGTSMAAPHVAGVVSLLKALKADLTADEALAVLQATARPLDATQCNRPSGDECGAGLIDAFAAAQMVQSGSIPEPEPEPEPGQLSFTPNPVAMGTSESMTYTITNTGSSSATWQVAGYLASSSNPGEMQAGAVYIPDGYPSSGTLAAGASVGTAIAVDRTKVTADGSYAFDLVFDVGGAEQSVPVTFTKSSTGSSGPTGPMLVAAFVQTGSGEVLGGLQESEGVITSFSFESAPGPSVVVAWSDENGNSTVDDGDYYGEHPNLVNVASGAESSGVDITMSVYSSTTSADNAAHAQRLEAYAEGASAED